MKLPELGETGGRGPARRPAESSLAWCLPRSRSSLIDRLADAGLPVVEATSFVFAQVGAADGRQRGRSWRASGASLASAIRCWCPEPERARGRHGCRVSRRSRGPRRGHRGVSRRNTNRSIAESFERFAPRVQDARSMPV